jgi:3-deoxy-D-manno-octulosonate 8-phosphate phosphatase (KDO 8-P phosphatase)
MAPIDKELFMAKAGDIHLLALDVDGVLTDGSIVYDSRGEQIQSFHVHDGFGLKLLDLAGIHIAIISSRNSPALTVRANELGINLVYQGLHNKMEAYEKIKKKLGIVDKRIGYIGDDWVDIPILKKAGLAIVVADAPYSVREYADYITQKPGGRGAVREVCELILVAHKKKTEILNRYLKF